MPARADRRKRTPRAVALAVGLAVAVAALAVAAAIARRQPSGSGGAACFAEARTDAPRRVLTATGAAAVERCWEVWQRGAFAAAPGPERLAPCVLPGGRLGVFPGGPEVCARLGLAAAGTASTEDPDVAALGNRLAQAKASSTCTLPAIMREAAFHALDELGMSGWSVVNSPGPAFTNEHPCASFVIDEPQRRVVLVPAPPSG